MVDFNSVSVSGPARAYTLDLEGPVDPTIIRSSAKVVNVCKNCASENLFQSEASYKLDVKEANRKNKNAVKSRKWLLCIFILSLFGICSMFLNIASGDLIIFSLFAIILSYIVFRIRQG